jgi:hypothetical protein
MAKDTFIYHITDLDLEELTAEEAGVLLKAIVKYVSTGEKTVFEDRFLRSEFKRLTDHHDADSAAYQEKCKQNAENGAKGGRPKKTEQNRTVSEKTERFLENQSQAKKAYSDNDINNDVINNQKEKINKKEKEVRHRFGEYKHILLTEQEYSRLVEEFGEDRTQKAIRKVDEYCEQHGKTYKNYNLVLRNWGYDKKPRSDVPESILSTVWG